MAEIDRQGVGIGLAVAIEENLGDPACGWARHYRPLIRTGADQRVCAACVLTLYGAAAPTGGCPRD